MEIVTGRTKVLSATDFSFRHNKCLAYYRSLFWLAQINECIYYVLSWQVAHKKRATANHLTYTVHKGIRIASLFKSTQKLKIKISLRNAAGVFVDFKLAADHAEREREYIDGDACSPEKCSH